MPGGINPSGNIWPLRKYSNEKMINTMVEISSIQNANIATEYEIRNWSAAASTTLIAESTQISQSNGQRRYWRNAKKIPMTTGSVTNVYRSRLLTNNEAL